MISDQRMAEIRDSAKKLQELASKPREGEVTSKAHHIWAREMSSSVIPTNIEEAQITITNQSKLIFKLRSRIYELESKLKEDSVKTQRCNQKL